MSRMSLPLVSRDLMHLHPPTRLMAIRLREELEDRGHSIFIYVTWRHLRQQQIEHAEGQSKTDRGYHNLLDVETGDPASRAIDTAFVPEKLGPRKDPWHSTHPWDLLRGCAEAIGFWAEAWHLGDKGHFVDDPKHNFKVLWAPQAHWHRTLRYRMLDPYRMV